MLSGAFDLYLSDEVVIIHKAWGQPRAKWCLLEPLLRCSPAREHLGYPSGSDRMWLFIGMISMTDRKHDGHAQFPGDKAKEHFKGFFFLIIFLKSSVLS